MVTSGINLVGGLGSISGSLGSKTAAVETNSGEGFKNVLSQAMSKFESVGDDTAQSTLDLLTGNTNDLSQTMIASQKSEIALNLTVAIRNKAVEAYKEIMNMQV